MKTPFWTVVLKQVLADGKWHTLATASGVPTFESEDEAREEADRLNEERWPGFDWASDPETAYCPQLLGD